MFDALKKLFGTKSDRDLKEIKPLLNKCTSLLAEYKKLSNDELRNKTLEFKKRIYEAIQDEETQISEIKSRLETVYEIEVDEKETLYRTLDTLEKQSYDKTQEILIEILPEAFAVLRENG